MAEPDDAHREDAEHPPHSIEYPGRTGDLAQRPRDEMDDCGRGLPAGRRTLITGIADRLSGETLPD